MTFESTLTPVGMAVGARDPLAAVAPYAEQD